MGCARCATLVRSGPVYGLIEPLNNRTINRETGASELTAAWAGNQAILDERQDLEFFSHLASKALADGVWCPFE